jgi:predicted cytidylate kinase
MTPKRITISGNAGSGKSTAAKLLAKSLNYEYVSIGDFSRKYAQEQFNMNINEFQDYCKQYPEEDKKIDEKFMEYCNSKESLVIDYRLGFLFVKGSYNILLTVSDEIAAKRIQKAGRMNENTDLISIRKRNKQMRLRFLKLYKVDFLDKSNYHIVIDTDSFNLKCLIPIMTIIP